MITIYFVREREEEEEEDEEREQVLSGDATLGLNGGTEGSCLPRGLSA